MWETKGPLLCQEVEGLAPREELTTTYWDRKLSLWPSEPLGVWTQPFLCCLDELGQPMYNCVVWLPLLGLLARDSVLLLGYLSTSIGISSFFSYNVDV